VGERVSLFREPDAGNLPVRFDEREQETESGPTGLRRTKRKLRPIATGRLKPLRLFSTLLPWLLKNSFVENSQKNFAIGSPINDDLRFGGHFLSSKFRLF